MSVAPRLAIGIGLVFAVFAASMSARADDKDDNPKIDLVVTADKPGVMIEHRVNVVEGWQTTLGVPVYSTTAQWEPVCVAPCAVKVDPNAPFRVGGRGIAPSPEFTLPRDQNDNAKVALRVSAGSGLAYDVGVGLMTAGFVFVAAGGASALYAGSITNTSAETTLRGFGVGIIGAGALMLVVGAPMWIWGKSTVFSCPDRARLALSRGAFLF